MKTLLRNFVYLTVFFALVGCGSGEKKPPEKPPELSPEEKKKRDDQIKSMQNYYKGGPKKR